MVKCNFGYVFGTLTMRKLKKVYKRDIEVVYGLETINMHLIRI